MRALRSESRIPPGRRRGGAFFRLLLLIFSLSLFAALVVAVIIMLAGVSTPEILVPNVTGLRLDDDTAAGVRGAHARLRDSDLADTVKFEYGPDSLVGVVLRQTPPAGQRVKAGRLVFLTVGAPSALLKVPQLVKLNLQEAAVRLQEAGKESGLPGLRLGAQIHRFTTSESRGIVLEQSIAPGTLKLSGTAVDLIIATDQKNDSSQMPCVVSLPLAEAKAVIRRTGFTDIQVIGSTDPTKPLHQVITQVPVTGTPLTDKTEIRLTVAVGADQHGQPVYSFEDDDTIANTPATAYPGGQTP